MVYAFCVEPAAIKHRSADTHGRHCHGKGVLTRSLDLLGRSACMLRDESMALPKLIPKHVCFGVPLYANGPRVCRTRDTLHHFG